MIRTLISLAMAVGALTLSACSQVPLSYQPTLANVETIKSSNVAPMNVGPFALAPGRAPTMDQGVQARAANVTSSVNNSFAAFLKDALTQELRAAGKFDPNSGIVVTGLLTKNELDASMGTGKAVLAANFAVTREGASVYNKELEEKAEWPSGFVGAEAIPLAINNYTSLYKKLLAKLFGDSDFKAATKAK